MLQLDQILLVVACNLLYGEEWGTSSLKTVVLFASSKDSQKCSTRMLFSLPLKERSTLQHLYLWPPDIKMAPEWRHCVPRLHPCLLWVSPSLIYDSAQHTLVKHWTCLICGHNYKTLESTITSRCFRSLDKKSSLCLILSGISTHEAFGPRPGTSKKEVSGISWQCR